MTTSSIMLTGRWLHYGIEHHESGLSQGVYSAHEWGKACAQAKAWGMTGVHPKVADGGGFWYDDSGLSMLRDTAHGQGLLIAPYHFCWGNTPERRTSVQQEAAVAAKIGKVFGVVVPDMEDAWFNHGDWMQEFGFSIRHSFGYAGPIIPTTYANPTVQSRFPYVQMNAFASAWIPQVYFDEWTFNGHQSTAKEGIDYVYPQWVELDKLCRLHGDGPLKPILPLIGLTKNIATHEIANWLIAMHGYGYCGFWYDGVYAPYAETIARAPVPGLKVEPPPGEPPAKDFKRPAFEREWTKLVPHVSVTSGIANADWVDYQESKFHGPALCDEYDDETWDGTPCRTLLTAGGRHQWVNGQHHYYPYV